MRPWLLIFTVVCLTSACSVRQYALNRAADTLAASGTSFASDGDPELIRDAAPFSLKLMDSVLEETPNNVGLLTAATRNYTQFAYAFVQQDGEVLEDTDVAGATTRFERARGLYVRARDYGLRGLDAAHPGLGVVLAHNPRSALVQASRSDVPLLYWTAVATAAWINLSKQDPAAIAQLPLVEALIDRAAALDEAWDAGAVHTFLISFEPSRARRAADTVQVVRKHFDRAVELTHGKQAAPYVAYAESVSVRAQDRKQFEQMLEKALAVDINAQPQWRLANVVMQRRARWLLGRTDQLFGE